MNEKGVCLAFFEEEQCVAVCLMYASMAGMPKKRLNSSFISVIHATDSTLNGCMANISAERIEQYNIF